MPGYGYLSENAAFADRAVAAGLIFIGPASESIRTIGDKVRRVPLVQVRRVLSLTRLRRPPRRHS